jgi:hypothetical protein
LQILTRHIAILVYFFPSLHSFNYALFRVGLLPDISGR